MESTQLIRICQIYPSTIPPIRFGIKKIVRKILVPLSFRVRRSASAKAMTFISTMEATAKSTVNLKELKNVRSEKIFL